MYDEWWFRPVWFWGRDIFVGEKLSLLIFSGGSAINPISRAHILGQGTLHHTIFNRWVCHHQGQNTVPTFHHFQGNPIWPCWTEFLLKKPEEMETNYPQVHLPVFKELRVWWKHLKSKSILHVVVPRSIWMTELSKLRLNRLTVQSCSCLVSANFPDKPSTLWHFCKVLGIAVAVLLCLLLWLPPRSTAQPNMMWLFCQVVWFGGFLKWWYPPKKHPKMIIFSMKTLFCWVPAF